MSFPAAARRTLQDAQLRRNLGKATSTIRAKRLATIAETCPRGCSHLPDAPDCAIMEAVAAGTLGDTGAARLDSLQRLLATFAPSNRTVSTER